MFDKLSIERKGTQWELHVENGARKRTQMMSNSECAIWLEKATEVVEDMARIDHRSLEEDFR